MKEDAIDDFIITVIPIVIGSGIPLFHEQNTEKKLGLTDMKRFGQAVLLHDKRA